MSSTCDNDQDDLYNGRPVTGYVNLNFEYLDIKTPL